MAEKVVLAKIGKSDAIKEAELIAYKNSITQELDSHINLYIKQKIGGNGNE